MSRNRYVVLCAFDVGGEANMAPGLPGDLIAVPPKELGKLSTAEIARPLQARMTSSFTKWRRMTRGRECSSK